MVELLCLVGSLFALLACVLIALRCRKIEKSIWEAAWVAIDRINYPASMSKGGDA